LAYLSKVLQGLREKGIVHLQRGLGGGVTLARMPSELTILDIVNAVEPIQRIKTCPLHLKSHGAKLCALHSRMDASLKSMEEAFAATTLAELLLEPNPSVPLCDS
jgi:Rrf2 family protein